MKKFLKRVLAPVVVGAMLVGVAGPAVANGEPGGPVTGASSSAYSEAISAALGEGLNAQIRLLGEDNIVADLLDILGINSLLDGTLQLTEELLGGVGGLVTSIVNLGATARTPAADSPLSPAPFALADNPLSVGDPASCSAESDTCYPVLPQASLDLGPLKLSAFNGVTELIGTEQPEKISAQAQTVDLDLNLLGIPLLSADAIRSAALCSFTAPDESDASSELAGVELLGGIIGLDVASDTGALIVKVLGNEIGLGTVDLSAPDYRRHVGNISSIVLDKDFLNVVVRTDLALLGVDLAADVLLKVGTATDHSGGYADASGLTIDVGVHLDANVSLLFIPIAKITTSNVAGNVLSLDLAHSSCSSSTTPTTDDEWITPGLT